MNLISLQFGVFQSRCRADYATRGVHFTSRLEGLFHTEAEQLLHHADHIVAGVIVVVPQDDVVWRLAAGFLRLSAFVFGNSYGLAERDRVT